MRKDCDYCRHQIMANDKDICKECERHYEDKFEPLLTKDNLCMCIYCKRIFNLKDPHPKIFVLEGDHTRGACFDCY